MIKAIMVIETVNFVNVGDQFDKVTSTIFETWGTIHKKNASKSQHSWRYGHEQNTCTLVNY